MKVLISHPTGNQNVRAAALSMAEAGMATSFSTTIATFPGTVLSRLGNVRFLSAIRRRRYDSRIKKITETSPWTELGRLISLAAGFARLTRQEYGRFSIDAVYRHLDKNVARGLEINAPRGLNTRKSAGS